MSYARSGIGTAQGAALYTGAVLGTGVLLLPALAADIAGPASILSWALMIMLSVPLAATFALLGSRFPDAGGVSNFVSRAFGPLAAGVTGWCFYGGVMLGTPSAAMMGALYVLAPLESGDAYAVMAAVIMYGLAALAIGNGIRASASLQLGVATLLSLTLIIVIFAALPHASRDNMMPFAPQGWLAVGHAASLLMFAFVGWEAVSPLSSEFRDPVRGIPWATFWALLITSVLYLGLAAITVGVLGPDAAKTRIPLTHLLSFWLGSQAQVVMAITAVMLTFGALIAYVGGGAKLGAALARDGLLPKMLARGHAAGEVPSRSLLVVVGFASCVFIAMSEKNAMLRFALHASSACFVAVYAAGAAAGIALLREHCGKQAMAVSAFVLSLVPLVFCGVFLLVPALFGLAGAMFHWRSTPTTR